MTAFATGGNLATALWPRRDCDHAPLIREQQQRITALEAENTSLKKQLHRFADLDEQQRHAIDDLTAALADARAALERQETT